MTKNVTNWGRGGISEEEVRKTVLEQRMSSQDMSGKITKAERNWEVLTEYIQVPSSSVMAFWVSIVHNIKPINFYDAANMETEAARCRGYRNRCPFSSSSSSISLSSSSSSLSWIPPIPMNFPPNFSSSSHCNHFYSFICHFSFAYNIRVLYCPFLTLPNTFYFFLLIIYPHLRNPWQEWMKWLECLRFLSASSHHKSQGFERGFKGEIWGQRHTHTTHTN